MCEKKTNSSEQKQKKESRLQSRGIVQTASFLYQRGESNRLEIVFYK